MNSDDLIPCVFLACVAATVCCIAICITVYNVSNPNCKCTAACCKAE